MIGDSAIANAVLRSKRRAYVIGTGLGQTNVYFYDAKGHQIEGLNVNVAHHIVTERNSAREVLVVRGAEENPKQIQIYECVPACSPAENASPAAPLPNYFILPNVTSVPGQAETSGGGG